MIPNLGLKAVVNILKTNEYPLKIDGLKMKCPFKVVPFQGTF